MQNGSDMKIARALWLSVGLAAGCLDLPPIGDTGDLASDIKWVSPTVSPAHTNGVIRLEVEVAGPVDVLELYRDDALLVRRTVGPFVHDWVTTAEAEGVHRISVRVIRGDTVILGAAREIVVDRTPPRVVSRTPENVGGLSPRTIPQVTFSEPMAPFPAGSLRFESAGQTVAVAAALSEDRSTASLTPSGALPRDTDIVVSVDTAANAPTDLAGNALGGIGDWRFRIPSWVQLGGDLSGLPGDTDAGPPSLLIDRNGRVIVAWTEQDSQGTKVFAARWEDGGWNYLGGGAIGPPGEKSLVRLFLTTSNNPAVLWTTWDRQAISYYWADERWSALPTLSIPTSTVVLPPGTPPPGNSLRTCVPIASTDRFFVFCDGDPSGQRLELNRGTWSGGALPATTNRQSFVVARGNGGQIVMGFTARQGTFPNETYSGHIIDESLDLVGPQLPRLGSVGVSDDGTTYAAWTDSGGFAIARLEGTQWLRFDTGFNDGSARTIGTSFAVDSDEQVFVAGRDSSATSNPVMVFVRRWTGDRWESLGPKLRAHWVDEDSAARQPGTPQIAIDGERHVVIAWDEANESIRRSIEVFRSND